MSKKDEPRTKLDSLFSSTTRPQQANTPLPPPASTQQYNFPENQLSTNQEGQITDNQEIEDDITPEVAKDEITESRIVSKQDKSKYGKAGYRLSPQSADQLEEMKLLLRRQLGRKVYYEEMIEEMIDQAYHDLKEKPQRSTLLKRLSRKTER